MLRTPARLKNKSRRSRSTSGSREKSGGAQQVNLTLGRTRSQTRIAQFSSSGDEVDRNTTAANDIRRDVIEQPRALSPEIPARQPEAEAQESGMADEQQPPQNEPENIQQQQAGLRAPGPGVQPPPAAPGNGNARAVPVMPAMDDWRNFFRALVGGQTDLPEFAGRDHEDPEVFLRECETSFAANNAEDHTRVRLAARALKDDAARWWAVYKNLNVTWQKFCELLRSKFASQSLLMRLSAKLYGQPQTDKERTGIFLEQRHLLARRLLPTALEEQIIAVLLESLRGSIKKLLRSSTFETVEDLITRAVQIEQDELEEKNVARRHTAATPAVQPPKQSAPSAPSAPVLAQPAIRSIQAPEQLPRCRFCPGRHWHRDCPQRQQDPQQENWRGAADAATGSAQPPAAQ